MRKLSIYTHLVKPSKIISASMPKQNLKNVDTAICRICLKASDTLVDIFAKREQIYNGQQEPGLADMLNECADCHIKCNDALPQQICLRCVQSAQNAYRFKRMCEKNYHQLLERRTHNTRSTRKEPRETKSEPKPKQLNQKEEKTKVYKCQFCIKEFAHLSILRLHKKWHLANKSVVKVNKSVVKVNTLAKRKIKQKQKQKPMFQCPICQKKFRLRTVLKNHMSTHSKQRPYACTTCPARFQLKTHLTRHMRGHTGECPYQCPFCEVSFARSDYCRGHMQRIHSGRKFVGKLPRKPRE